jgi:hypothetical protein
MIYFKKIEQKESLLKMLVNDEGKKCPEIDLNNNQIIEPIEEIIEIKSSPQSPTQINKDSQK